MIELLVELIHVASVPKRVLLAEAAAVRFHCFLNGAEDRFVFDSGWEFVGLALNDLPQHVSEDLAASGLWELVDDEDGLEAGNWADLLADEGDQLLLDSLSGIAVLNDHKTNGDFALQLLDLCDNRCL